jgi:protein O-mannosyl-transferase
MRKKEIPNRASRAVKVSSRSAAAASKAEQSSSQAQASEYIESLKPEGDGAQWRSVYALVPVALALLAYLNTLSNGFAIDDASHLSNTFIKKLGNLPFAFTGRVWALATEDVVLSLGSYYRPFLNVLFTINYALFGEAAWGWHLVNALIHAAVTLMVFVVFKTLTTRVWLAATTACLFAVHPSHAEAVAYISGAADLLMSVFLLSAFYFYLRYRKRNRKYLVAVSLGFYLLALFSKETALVLPFIIAYCELFYFKSRASLKQKAIAGLTLASLFIVPTALYYLIRYNAINTFVDNSPTRCSLLSTLATVPLVVAKYLKLMLVPTGYSYQHHTALVGTVSGFGFIAPVALLVAIAAAVFFVKSRELRFAALWFIITLAPALQAFRYLEPEYLVQERFLYLPSIGFCLAVALGIIWLATRSPLGSRGQILAAISTLLLVVVWGGVLIKQNRVWKDSLTVYKHAVAVDPLSASAHAVLAYTYFDLGKPREAEAEARASLDLDPKNANTYLTLSYFARAAGKLDKAIGYLETAKSEVAEAQMTRQNLATICLNLGLLYAQVKDFGRAEENLLKSIEFSPRLVAWNYTGMFYFDQKRFEEARVLFEKIASRTPNWFAPIHIRLGQTYEGLNQPGQARLHYQEYLERASAELPDRKSVQNRLRQMDSNTASPSP